MNLTLKRKIISIITSAITFSTVIGVCVSTFLLMDKKSFNTIFVSGGSMRPTLQGGHDDGCHPPYIDSNGNYVHGDYVNFGKVDYSLKAKRNIKRYDIVTTYFPTDYDSQGRLIDGADYKIKRVIALPGETFKITQGILYVKQSGSYVEIERKHLIEDDGKVSIKDVGEHTLNKDEYWVMGDHRSGSRDCVNFNKPVLLNYITGVLVSIEGVAEFYVHYQCGKCGHEVNELDYLKGRISSCPKCGGYIKATDGDIRNRQYTYPEII